MISKLFLIITGILFYANLYAQEFNTVITDKKTDKPMLIGYTTLEAFNDTSFSWWWNSAYNMYEADSAAAEELKVNIKDVDIKIVMGTWCSDSRTEVPHFYKILDEINYPKEEVTLINVNRDMQGLENEVEGLDINFVPTFIFYKAGEEIGRIIEMPYETLEKDMLELVSANVSGKE
ncbi:MAG: thioredoxin family protein [Bacteroidetes bacterium]|nr:thioredoxin family protein [Bacteroidota bacterium]MCH8033464.1 thioredoxin family protein [Bacteroidota bacterium]